MLSNTDRHVDLLFPGPPRGAGGRVGGGAGGPTMSLP
jgi:hypothetical protein